MQPVVIKIGGHELEARAGQLRAEDDRKRAAEHQQEDSSNAVLYTNDFVIVVNAKIARPGRLSRRGAVMQRRFDAAHPVDPICHRADGIEKTDSANDDSCDPDWFSGPGG